MDHPSAFPGANSPSFSLAEIWPFHGQINGESSGVLGVGRGGYGQNLSGFEEIGAAVDESGGGGGGGGGGKKRRRELAPLSEDESKLDSTSSGNEMNDNDGKLWESRNVGSKTGGEECSGLGNKPPDTDSTQPSEPPPKRDYIHVRARRGQATDSHSLAERARREKISERMKILQDLVPGCNKVIGKALVLDEIINYIQSLQRQVEFLSMKLEAVNSGVTPANDGYPPRDASQSMTFDAGMAFVAQTASECCQGSASEWLHMQVGGGFE